MKAKTRIYNDRAIFGYRRDSIAFANINIMDMAIDGIDNEIMSVAIFV